MSREMPLLEHKPHTTLLKIVLRLLKKTKAKQWVRLKMSMCRLVLPSRQWIRLMSMMKKLRQPSKQSKSLSRTTRAKMMKLQRKLLMSAKSKKRKHLRSKCRYMTSTRTLISSSRLLMN
jgi:hypothetical protein